MPTVVFFFLATLYDLNPPEVNVLIKSGLEFTYVEEFDSARIYFDQIIELYPENPAGYFFRAILLQFKMMDECQYAPEEEYYSLMKQVAKRAQQILEKEENLWAEFYLGSSYTYRAVYEGMRNNYFETFKHGVKGGRMLQGILKKDSTFYEAYLGAGTFEYFWARAARYLPVLKLVGGNVNEAIKKLLVAVEKSLYSEPVSLNSLVFIYGEEGDFDKASNIIDSLLARYPEARTFLWSKAKLEFKKENYFTAAEVYSKLFSMYERQSNKNYANLAQCKLYIGKCFYELKDKDEAREALKDVIGYKKHSDRFPEIKEYCREAYGLLSRIF